MTCDVTEEMSETEESEESRKAITGGAHIEK